MVLPPDPEDGVGLILLNSNADTHFSFTNALGTISSEQARRIEVASAQYPHACWVITLHHHLVEYPRAATALSERIGTALINGNWFVRRLQFLTGRAVFMHGHRHVDWVGECAGLRIVSAPSPIMEATDDLAACFYIHTLAVGPDRHLRLLRPQRVTIAGQTLSDDWGRGAEAQSGSLRVRRSRTGAGFSQPGIWAMANDLIPQTALMRERSAQNITIGVAPVHNRVPRRESPPIEQTRDARRRRETQ